MPLTLVHSSPGPSYDDGMILLDNDGTPVPLRARADPDRKPGDMPQGDPGDEDPPQPIDEPKDFDQGGDRADFKKFA